jgi:hypothetical protein
LLQKEVLFREAGSRVHPSARVPPVSLSGCGTLVVMNVPPFIVGELLILET